MRQLEVVALSDDGTYVLLAGSEDAARATHALRIDNRLHAALRGELEDPDRRESELPVKDMQSRLRAGESIEEVAKAARVPMSRVMRYAGPVISERDRIVDQARAAKVQRPRGVEATLPLGETADKRLAATAGLHADTVEWTARRRDDGAWVVTLNYSARGGARSASWLWEPVSRQLTSINALGTRLGSDEAPPQRRKRPAPARATSPRSDRARGARTTASGGTARGRAARPSARQTSDAAEPRERRTIDDAAIAAPARRANGRVPVPSWSDVLLGVSAPADAPPRRRSTSKATAAGRGRRRS